jgi:tRNA-Thr(GGU) m(6)t(6)A37 methyltransferase TsaA
MTPITITPLAHVRSPRTEPTDDFWGNVISTIELDGSLVTADSVLGLSDFSHILVVYHLDKIADTNIVWSADHPRGNLNWPKVGIFAQRKKARPNRIGVSVCELLEVKDLILKVRALDAIDGTPVLDIKPHIKEFVPDSALLRQPQWTTELMKDYYS